FADESQSLWVDCVFIYESFPSNSMLKLREVVSTLFDVDRRHTFHSCSLRDLWSVLLMIRCYRSTSFPSCALLLY
uniref:Clathrin heavy chain n=1 Tax=Parascaris univalens TaxID=6257 RepID=A0A915BZ14_PARUN